MARLTKYEIAAKIERLPGNTPCSWPSLATLYYEDMSREELVERHNRIIERRGLSVDPIQ